MRSRYAITLFLIALPVAIGNTSVTQAQPPELPADLSALSTSDFIALAAAVVPVRSADAENKAALRAEAARRLTETDAATGESLTNVNELFRFGRGELDEQEQATLLSVIRSRTSDIATLGYTDLQLAFYLETELAPNPERAKIGARMVADWAAGQDIAALDRMQLLWLTGRINRNAFGIRAFRVTWTGEITPPATGDYTFSVSPHNINIYEASDFYYEQSMQVRLAGTQVVNATAEDWDYEGEPIALTAGQSVPLVVEFSYECAEGDAPNRPAGRPIQTGRSPHAVLQWKGPGFGKSTVDPSALKQQGSGEPGLVAEYTLINRNANENTVVTVTEPNIDHAWMGGAHFISEHRDIENRLLDRLWEVCMAPAYLDECTAPVTEENPAVLHVFLDYIRQSARMTAARRAAFLTELLNRPTMIERLSLKQVFDVHNHYRYGAEDEAIAVLGEWMQRNPNAVPEPTPTIDEFYRVNRFWYGNLTNSTLLIYPEFFTVLESEYLELPEGGCSLPVAYVLAYGYLEQGQIMDWIEKLDTRLADDSLTGDKRVNWLIARAMAEEIRRGGSSHIRRADGDLLAGMEWLDEAALTAVEPTTKARIATERAARLATKHKWELSLEAMQPYAASVPDWPERIDKLQKVVERRVRQQAARSRNDLIRQLQDRKAAADSRGDSARSQEFQAAIDQLLEN